MAALPAIMSSCSATTLSSADHGTSRDGKPTSRSTTTSTSPVGYLAPGHYQFSLSFDGAARSYLVHVPPRATFDRPLPMVINLHGSTSNGIEEEAYSQMDQTADEYGFLAVYPNGTPVFKGATGQLAWNAGSCCGLPATSNVDDVGFILSVLADLQQRTRVDDKRVYVTGMSNGGMMAHRLAAQAASHFAAGASVAGQVTIQAVSPSRPVPMMEFHSVDDPDANWNGEPGPPGAGDQLPPVLAGIGQWVQADRCPETPRVGTTLSGAAGTINAGLTATAITYGPCSEGAQVVLWKFTGSGHVWPGSPLSINSGSGPHLGRPITLVDADDAMWLFFASYALP